MSVQSPLILVDGEDVLAFRSLDALLSWVEVPDVADGLYRVFDSQGQVLRLVVEPREGLRRGGDILCLGTGRFDRDELRRIVESAVRGGEHTGSEPPENLEGLIERLFKG